MKYIMKTIKTIGCIFFLGMTTQLADAQTPGPTTVPYSAFPARLQAYVDTNPDEAQKGIIDVTLPPYNAAGDGIADDTQAIQDAIDDAYNNNFAVYLAVNKIFLVSQQLRLITTTESRRYGHQLLGDANGTKPIIRLVDGSGLGGNNNYDDALIRFQYDNGQGGTEPAKHYTATFRNIDIDMGNNPAATALTMAGAQHCVIEDIKIYGEAFDVGIKDLPGSGGSTVNVHIIGGNIGIHQDQNRTVPTLIGLVLEEQKDRGIKLTNTQGPLVIAGFKISSTQALSTDYRAIFLNNVNKNEVVVGDVTVVDHANSNLSLTDGSIEVAGANGVAIRNGRQDLTLVNVYIKANTLIENGVFTAPTSYVQGDENQWKKISQHYYTSILDKSSVVIDGQSLNDRTDSYESTGTITDEIPVTAIQNGDMETTDNLTWPWNLKIDNSNTNTPGAATITYEAHNDGTTGHFLQVEVTAANTEKPWNLRVRQNVEVGSEATKIMFRARGTEEGQLLRIRYDGNGVTKPQDDFILTTTWADYELALPASSQGTTNWLSFWTQSVGTYQFDNVEGETKLYTKHSYGEVPDFKNPNIVDITTYGATTANDNPNDDDGAAIQSAIDDVTNPASANYGKTVLIPRGNFGIDTPIVVKQGTKLIGTAKNISTIYANNPWSNDNGAIITTVDDANGEVILSDFSIMGYPRMCYLRVQSGNTVVRDIMTEDKIAWGWPGTSYDWKYVNPRVGTYLDFNLNAGGKVYHISTGQLTKNDRWNPSPNQPNYHHVRVQNTSNPLTFYQSSVEHHVFSPKFLVENVSNLTIFGFKYEGPGELLHIVNSDNIEICGGAGNYYMDKDGDQTIIDISNSTNILLRTMSRKTVHGRYILGRSYPVNDITQFWLTDSGTEVSPYHAILWYQVGNPTTLNVEETTNIGSKLYVYPNPVNDYVHISSLNPASAYQYRFVNLLGMVVQEDILNGDTIHCSSLPSGVYVLNIYSKRDHYNIKVIKK
jgi:hypothetical protein